MIRSLSPSDAAAIERLIAENPLAAQWSAVSEASSVLVSEEEGRVVGIVVVRVVADEAEILNVVTDEAFRRRGLGTALLNAALALARSAGARRVFLEVRESNTVAWRFYVRMNFAEVYRRKMYYRDPDENALVLSRNLE